MIQLPNIPTFSEYKFLNEQQNTFNILLESLATAKKSFLTTGKIDKNDFDKLTNIDISKTKKYLDKLCKFFLDGASIDTLENEIARYDKLIIRNQIKEKDINIFKSYNDFSKFIDSYKNLDFDKEQSKIESIKKVKDLEVILDNDKFLIVSPKTHEMSCVYGAGTNWCITTKSDQWWNDYTNRFIEFYFIIQKGMDSKNPLYKIAVAVYPDKKEAKEVYDATDKIIDFSVVKKLGISEKIFKPMDLSKLKPDDWLKKWVTGKFTFNSDGSIDVNGGVNINNCPTPKIPIKFNKVSGYFIFGLNNLSSLEGCPNEVGGDFNCSYCNLESLEFAPEKVGGYFNCSNNQLTSLYGSPKEIGGKFNCYNNQITSLEFAPQKVGGDFIIQTNKLTSLKGVPKEVAGEFNCADNKLTSLEFAPKEIGGKFNCRFNQITSLEGAPQKVGGDFNCSNNRLISLKGAPQKVGGEFNCYDNKKLTSLKGVPKIVGGDFNCSYCNLESLEGAPEKVGGGFNCFSNNVDFTKNDVNQVCNVQGLIIA